VKDRSKQQNGEAVALHQVDECCRFAGPLTRFLGHVVATSICQGNSKVKMSG